MIASNMRRGSVIRLDGEVYTVMTCHHHTPGNLRALVQADLRNLKRGNKLSKRFRATEEVEEVYVETRTHEYLYPEADACVFMDTENYEQISVQKDALGDAMSYLLENMQVKLTFCDGQFAGAELPVNVVLEVTETEPGAKGDSRTNLFKPATLQTGLVVKVPLFVKQGEKIRVDTRTGEFVERAND